MKQSERGGGGSYHLVDFPVLFVISFSLLLLQLLAHIVSKLDINGRLESTDLVRPLPSCGGIVSPCWG
jgi:hypothetical protein